MDNRFGLKDFILMTLVLIVGVMVLLSMSQSDRLWGQVKSVQDKVGTIERQVAGVRDAIPADLAPVLRELADVKAKLAQIEASGVKVAPGSGAAVASGDKPAPPPVRSDRDESWARPGVPVQWQPAYTMTTDPRGLKGFQEGGSFTEIFDARPAKVTPYIQTDVYGRRAVDMVMESPGVYDPKTLRLVGQLSDAWQQDPKGLWVRFKLRAGVRHSDGTAITAEDFRYTFHDFIMNPQIEAQRVRSTLSDQIDQVIAVAPDVVEVTFKQALFSNLDSALTLWPLPKHFYSQYTPAQINSMPGLLMGSGPFKMRDISWTPDKPLVLERNEQYWGPKPALRELRFLTINDETPRLVAFRNREGDMTTPSSPQFVTLSQDPAFKRDNHTLNWLNMKSGRSALIWNCGERNGKLTPFADKRVRRAMTLMLNREKMIRDIWKGIGEVPNGFINPGSVGYDEALRPPPYDVKAGLALLKEAGYEDRDGNGTLEDKEGKPFTFEFTYFTGGEIAERIALFVKDTYEQVGIKVNLRGMDWSVGDPMRKQRDFDVLTMGWGANAPESDPKQIFHSDSIKDQGDNFAQYSNPEMDKAIDALRLELDVEKRAQLWKQFSRIMDEDQPYTWVRVAPFLRFVNGEIGNVNMYPKGMEPQEFFRGGPALLPVSGN